MSRRRMTAAALAALVALSLCCASLCLIRHAAHDCTGEDCAVCRTLCRCVSVLKTLSRAAMAPALAVLSTACALALQRAESRDVCLRTPVTLRVKLSN